jgi:hypothetical protein
MPWLLNRKAIGNFRPAGPGTVKEQRGSFFEYAPEKDEGDFKRNLGI